MHLNYLNHGTDECLLGFDDVQTFFGVVTPFVQVESAEL